MLYIASDHAGLKLKKYLTRYIEKQLNIPFEDMGPTEYVSTDDFPDYAAPLAQKVAEDPTNQGVLICGSGHGVCITANKINGIRAIQGYSIKGAEMGRRHNDANILCLAGQVLTEEHSVSILNKFLETNFEKEDRLVRRNCKITKIEKKNLCQ